MSGRERDDAGARVGGPGPRRAVPAARTLSPEVSAGASPSPAPGAGPPKVDGRGYTFSQPVPGASPERAGYTSPGRSPGIRAYGWLEPCKGETSAVVAPSGTTASAGGSACPERRCCALSGLRPLARRGPRASPWAGMSRPSGADSGHFPRTRAHRAASPSTSHVPDGFTECVPAARGPRTLCVCSMTAYDCSVRLCPFVAPLLRRSPRHGPSVSLRSWLRIFYLESPGESSVRSGCRVGEPKGLHGLPDCPGLGVFRCRRPNRGPLGGARARQVVHSHLGSVGLAMTPAAQAASG